MISIQLKLDDLIQMRFAYSPLIELSLSYKMAKHPKNFGLYQAWIEEARGAIGTTEFPHMDATILAHSYLADFVTPTPTQRVLRIEEELNRIRETDWSIVNANMQFLIELDGITDARRHFLDDPEAALEALIEEMRDYWNRTLAHHWQRMKAVLEGDVLYRAKHLALDGVASLFANLSKALEYQEQELRILKMKRPDCDHFEFSLSGNGIQLVPSVFAACKVSYQLTPEWHPMLIYGARGAGLWHQDELVDVDEALELTMGAGRAKILQSLQEPVNTGELARQLHVTAGAVSQHLSRLNQAGLVESDRSGNRVYYRLSHRGEQLLELFVS